MRKKIYEILRKSVARKATGGLGRVETYDDEIVCYVDGKKLKKKEKYLYRYNLKFRSIPSSSELYQIYRVDKPVHYIIENVDFDRQINIQASMKDCHVTFDNCTFTGAVEIDFADHITFKNNKYRGQTYKNYHSIYKEGEFCISSRRHKSEINKIDFLGNRIEFPDSEENIIAVYLYGKEITLINTDVANAKNIEIGADNLELYNSSIHAEEIEIDTQNIDFDHSEITSGIISIDTVRIVDAIKVNYNVLFFNGVEVNKHETVVDSHSLELQQQRLELLNTLNKIGTSCEDTIADIIKREPLTRVLRK